VCDRCWQPISGRPCWHLLMGVRIHSQKSHGSCLLAAPYRTTENVQETAHAPTPELVSTALPLQNKTTVEHHEGVTAHAHYRQLGEAFTHPYDVGFGENARQVLGTHWTSWPVPGIGLAGDGLRFPSSLAPSARQRLQDSLPNPATEASVLLTDRKREVYADQLR
jgi:hypothetical protein